MIIRDKYVEAAGGPGDDQFYIESTSGVYFQINDSDPGDSLYYNGYKLEGGTKIVLDLELSEGNYTVGATDSNGFLYFAYSDGGLVIILPDYSCSISITDWQNGDLGIHIDSLITWDEVTLNWDYDSQQYVSFSTTLALSNIVQDNSLSNFMDLPGAAYMMSHHGEIEIPTQPVSPP